MVFLSGNATTPSTVKAMLQGAVDFLMKCDPDGDLLEAVGNAMLLDGLRHACRRALAEIQSIHNIR
jgi:FixJ family two-component response regulator